MEVMKQRVKLKDSNGKLYGKNTSVINCYVIKFVLDVKEILFFVIFKITYIYR